MDNTDNIPAEESGVAAEASESALSTQAADDTTLPTSSDNGDNAPIKNPLARQIDYTFAANDVDAAINDQLKNIAKKTHINGFRSGHVPLRVMWQRWGARCLTEALNERAGKQFSEQAPTMEERPAAYPRFETATISKDGYYHVTCHYETLPDITLPDLSEQKITRPVLEVGDSEIDEMITRLRRDSGHYHEAARAAQLEDSITVDFQAYRADEVAEKGKDRRWVLGSSLLSKEITDQLIGVKSNEQRTVTIRYPDDYPDESLRGVETRLEVTVNKVEELHLPELNDEFYSRYGVNDGGESFRKMVGERLRDEVTNRLRQALHTQAMSALLSATKPFSLPQSMVQMECLSMLRQMRAQAEQHGLPLPSQFTPQMYSEATRRVALGLIIARWQENEKIEITDEEINARLDEIADSYEDPETFKKRTREDNQSMHTLRLEIIEQRVAQWVCEKSQMTDKTLSLNELLGAGVNG